MVDSLQDRWGAQALDVNGAWDRYQNVVKSGLAVTINTGTLGSTDTLSVATGTAVVAGTTHSVSSTNAQVDAADSNNPRKDVVYVDSAGAVQVAKGAPEATSPTGAVRRKTYRPAPPDLSGTDAAVLAEVWVPAGASSIASADLTDRRLLADAVFNSVGTDDLAVDSDVVLGFGSGAGLVNSYVIADFADVGAAINQASTDGAAGVFVPQGNHDFSTTVTPSSPLVIAGPTGQTGSPRGARLNYTGSGTAVSEASNNRNIKLVDVWLRGPGSGGATTGLDVSGKLSLVRANVANFGTGVTLNTSTYAHFTDSAINNNGVGVTGDANAWGIDHTRISDNDGNGLDPSGLAVLAVYGGSSFEGNGDRGINALVSQSADIELLSVRDCYVEGNTTIGIQAGNNGAGDARQVNVRDNRVRPADNSTAAIRLQALTGGVVAGNEIDSRTATTNDVTWGIEDRSDASNLTMYGNSFVGSNFGSGKYREAAPQSTIDGRVMAPETLDLGGTDGTVSPTDFEADVIPFLIDAGGSATELEGIGGSTRREGQTVRVIHTGGENVTLVNNDTAETDPLINQGGANVTLGTNGDVAEYTYSTQASKWIMTGKATTQ